MAESELSRLEAGLLMYKDSPLVKHGMSKQWTDNSLDVSFKDTIKSLLIWQVLSQTWRPA
jgi:hypothetical protein